MLSKEKNLQKRGYKRIIGLDEAGRGPIAGPVVAGAVAFNNLRIRDFKGIKDSKKLSPKKREYFYNLLINNPGIDWAAAKVSQRVIDRINILNAVKRAMAGIVKKMKPDYLIIDGNFSIKSKIPQESIIKGDEKVFSCMAASIIAKVTRDRIMKRYAVRYPEYQFEKHKGYPTKLHLKLLKKYGACPIHRKSFRPVLCLKDKPGGLCKSS